MGEVVLSKWDSVNSKSTLSIFLIALLFVGTALSISSTMSYYEEIKTQPDQGFVNTVSWFIDHVQQKNAKIYSDYPYYRSLLFPGITFADELSISAVKSNPNIFYALLEYNIDYIFIHEPSSFSKGIFKGDIFSPIYGEGENSIVSINRTLLKGYLNTQPVLLNDYSSSLNEYFDNVTVSRVKSAFVAYNISVTADSLDKIDGAASTQLTLSSKDGAATAYIEKTLEPTDFTGERFVFWVKPVSNVLSVGFELRDSSSQRVYMWEWQSYFYSAYLKTAVDGWFPLYVNVGEGGDSTHWEQGSGNVSRVTQIMFKCVAPIDTENASMKFDSFYRLSPKHLINITLQDFSGQFLAPSVIGVQENGSTAYSSTITSGEIHTLSFELNKSYALLLSIGGKFYGEFYSGFVDRNINITVTIMEQKLSVKVSDMY